MPTIRYAPQFRSYLMTVRNEEDIKDFGYGWFAKYYIKEVGVILTKPRQAPRAPSIPEISTPQSLESFMEEHNAWKARMRKWIDSKLPARKEVSP